MKSVDELELYLLPIFGAEEDEDEDEDEGEGAPKVKPSPGTMKKTVKKVVKKVDDDDDDDDDDEDDLSHIEDPKDRRIAELSRENGKRRRAARETAKELKRIQDEAKAAENAKKPETDRLQSTVAEQAATIEALEKRVSASVLRSAIMEHDKFTWHDIGSVLHEINFEDLDIDTEAGAVDGLEDELKRIAKAKPFLVKKRAGGTGGTRQTGSNPGGGDQTRPPVVTDKEALRKKYGMNR